MLTSANLSDSESIAARICSARPSASVRTVASRGCIKTTRASLLKGGSPISVEDFLSAATQAQLTGKKARLVLALLLFGFLVLAGVFLYSLG